MLDSMIQYNTLGLSVATAITLMCMGMLGVRYIGIDYRNRYHCPSNSAISGSNSLLFTTLRLCIGRANSMYEQCIESLLVQPRTTSCSNNKW